MDDTGAFGSGNFAPGCMIGRYTNMYKDIMSSLQTQMCGGGSSINPSEMMMLQMQMNTLSQVGQGISQTISNIQGIVSNAVRNFKGS